MCSHTHTHTPPPLRHHHHHHHHQEQARRPAAKRPSNQQDQDPAHTAAEPPRKKIPAASRQPTDSSSTDQTADVAATGDQTSGAPAAASSDSGHKSAPATAAADRRGDAPTASEPAHTQSAKSRTKVPQQRAAMLDLLAAFVQSLSGSALSSLKGSLEGTLSAASSDDCVRALYGVLIDDAEVVSTTPDERKKAEAALKRWEGAEAWTNFKKGDSVARLKRRLTINLRNKKKQLCKGTAAAVAKAGEAAAGRATPTLGAEAAATAASGPQQPHAEPGAAPSGQEVAPAPAAVGAAEEKREAAAPLAGGGRPSQDSSGDAAAHDAAPTTSNGAVPPSASPHQADAGAGDEVAGRGADESEVAARGADAVVSREADAVVSRDADAAAARDADEVVARDADEVTTSDADEVTTSDADAVAARDADEVTTSDADAAAAPDADADAAAPARGAGRAAPESRPRAPAAPIPAKADEVGTLLRELADSRPLRQKLDAAKECAKSLAFESMSKPDEDQHLATLRDIKALIEEVAALQQASVESPMIDAFVLEMMTAKLRAVYNVVF